MLLVIDIGNSAIGAAIFDGEQIIFKSHKRRPDKFDTAYLENLIQVDRNRDIDGVMVASVVPSFDAAVFGVVRECLGVEPTFITHQSDTGIKIVIDDPYELGADRIAVVVGALCLCKPPLVVLDSGTATTFDLVNRNHEYIGGAIFPGIEISIKSLADHTAKLEKIPFEVPESPVGSNTADCIRSGIFYSYIGGLGYMIELYKTMLGEGTSVIATGGLVRFFRNKITAIDRFEADLIFIGLKAIADRQKPPID